MKRMSFFIMLFIAGLAYASPVKSNIGARDTMNEGGKPKPYDAEIDYIGVKRYQRSYIDTGVVLQESDGTTHNFVVTYTANSPGSWGFISFGFSTSHWLGVCPGLVYFGNANIRYDVSAATGWANYCFDSQSGWYVNGEQKVSDTWDVSTNTRTTIKGKSFWILMTRDVRYDDQRYILEYTVTARYRSIRIELDGVLVRDYIPVRITNEDGLREGALYDCVSGEVFRDVGTGAGFEIGPDL